jgi:hypothetical protein
VLVGFVVGSVVGFVFRALKLAPVCRSDVWSADEVSIVSYRRVGVCVL